MKSYLHYVYAILAVPVAILLRFALIPLTGHGTPFITLFPATVIVALLGGMGPAVLTGTFGVLVADYFFIPPLHSLDISIDFWSRSAVVVLTSTFVGYIGAVLRDARAKAEQQTLVLRDSQKDLNRAQAVANTGSWRLDVRQNELLWSSETYRIFGIDEGTPLTYETFLANVHPDDQDFVDKSWNAALKGECYDIEHRIVVNGNIKWVRERAELEFDKSGTLLGGFGTVTDITQRKQMENELRQARDELELRVKERTAKLNETVLALQKQVELRIEAQEGIKTERQRLNNVLETLPVYVVLLTEDYHVPFANRFFEERFGKSNGKRCFEYLFGRTEPCEICETYKVLKTNKPHHWEWTGPDGCNYDIFDFPFTDTDGSRLIMEMGIDITEQKRAQEALRSTSLYARGLLEASLDPLVTISPEGKITDVNKAAELVTGLSRERLIGSDFSDYFTEPQKAEEVYQKVLSEGQIKNYLLSIRHKSGHITDVLYNATVFKNEVGHVQGVFAAARDITEKKAAEAELEKYRLHLEDLVKQRTEELTRSNKELEQFAYVASHDLQEPLRIIAGYTQLLQQRYKGKLDEDADQFIFYMVDGAARMQNLINDLLSYSRIETRGKSFESVDCKTVIDDVLAALQMTIEDNKAVIKYGPLPTINADRTQLFQLFQNLIGNAIKFRSDKPPRIHITAKPQNGRWLFSVKDNGIGIDPKYSERIFVIFQRLHSQDKYPGTGIGLAICKKIVERHGGRIWMESQFGKGATFYFIL
jgi:PAS domain S-box-containing protein